MLLPHMFMFGSLDHYDLTKLHVLGISSWIGRPHFNFLLFPCFVVLSGFISSLSQLAWEKRLCCCCCCIEKYGQDGWVYATLVPYKTRKQTKLAGKLFMNIPQLGRWLFFLILVHPIYFRRQTLLYNLKQLG